MTSNPVVALTSSRNVTGSSPSSEALRRLPPQLTLERSLRSLASSFVMTNPCSRNVTSRSSRNAISRSSFNVTGSSPLSEASGRLRPQLTLARSLASLSARMRRSSPSAIWSTSKTFPLASLASGHSSARSRTSSNPATSTRPRTLPRPLVTLSVRTLTILSSATLISRRSFPPASSRTWRTWRRAT